MKTNHQHPVALITGGARRIGAHIVETLNTKGYRVAIHYRHSHDEAESLNNKLNSIRPNSSMLVEADFEQHETLATMIDSVAEHFGRLDLLINNASQYFPTPFGSTTRQQWDTLMQSNLEAPYFLSQHALEHLKNSKGSIVNITDINGQRPLTEYSAYCVAKAGLTMLTRSLACELGPAVRVNAVAPGTTLWPEHVPVADQDAVLQDSSLRRLVDPQDIANAVLFFAKHESLTGQVLNVDCGRII